MLVALVPASIAAYAGKGVASVIRSTVATLSGSEPDYVSPTSSRRWYRTPVRQSHLLALALSGCAIVGAVPVYATSVARGQPIVLWVTTIWQMISLVAWAFAAPGLLRVWRRVRRIDAQGITAAEMLIHATIVTAIALTHSLALPAIASLLLIPIGPGGLSAAVTWAFAAYLPLDLLTYSLIIGLGHASDASRRDRAAAVRESAVQGELATSRLVSLRAQLRPHFLFNALNAVILLARRNDSEGAARLLTQISDLLRYVLRQPDEGGDKAMVALSEELDFAESYLAIERERFPDRLRTHFEVATEARTALVPHLLLQPLVENAVRHGIASRLGIGTVSIRAWREGNMIHISVEDDGAGVDHGIHSTGIGLPNTRARLNTLYGAEAALSLNALPGGGAAAHVVLPFRK